MFKSISSLGLKNFVARSLNLLLWMAHTHANVPTNVGNNDADVMLKLLKMLYMCHFNILLVNNSHGTGQDSFTYSMQIDFYLFLFRGWSFFFSFLCHFHSHKKVHWNPAMHSNKEISWKICECSISLKAWILIWNVTHKLKNLLV